MERGRPARIPDLGRPVRGAEDWWGMFLPMIFKPHPYPGDMPTKPPPDIGDSIKFSVNGLPPMKDEHFSIRNPGHKNHTRFLAVRDSAIRAMNGRCWYVGPIQVEFSLYCSSPEGSLFDYLGGIADSLDGSHGPSFTYLPICYQDDCQISMIRSSVVSSESDHYALKITFLDPDGNVEPALLRQLESDSCQLSR